MPIGLAAAEVDPAAEVVEQVVLQHPNRHISLHFLVGLWLFLEVGKIYKKLKRYFALHEPAY
jgi:predicted transcriptional regulator